MLQMTVLEYTSKQPGRYLYTVLGRSYDLYVDDGCLIIAPTLGTLFAIPEQQSNNFKCSYDTYNLA